MTPETLPPTLLLVPGHWLGAWAWDEVLEHLAALGQPALALTLPGLDAADPGRAARTLDEQVAALEAAAANIAGPVVVVAHSGANAPVSLLLDRRPELLARVIWVDSGPVAPDTVFAPDCAADLAELPLPPLEQLAKQASLAGLSAASLDRFRERAVPEPGPILREPVRLGNDARRAVPATFVCCSLPSAQVLALAEAGHPMFAEVARLRSATVVDLPTGHWPMWSRPAELARELAAAVSA